jgi:hypothetical protein
MIKLFDTLQNYEPNTKIRVYNEDTQEITEGTVAQAFGWYDLIEFNYTVITQHIEIKDNMICVHVTDTRNYGRE